MYFNNPSSSLITIGDDTTDTQPPPDSSSSWSSSPPPPASASPPPPASSPPPPVKTPSPSPPPPEQPKNPPSEPAPTVPNPPIQNPSTPAQPLPNPPPGNALPPPSGTELPKSPEGQFPPPASNDFPASSLAPPLSNSPPGSQLTSQVSPPPSSSNSSMVVIVGIAVGGGLIFALIVACFLTKQRRKKRSYYYENGRTHRSNEWNNSSSNDHVVKLPTLPHNGVGNGQWGAPPPNFSGEYNNNYSGQHGPPSPMGMGGMGYSSQSQFSYEELAAATSGFAQSNLLGQGGFGYVYKGVLPDGKVVAVKSLKSGSGQGEREFQAEVDIISRVHHRHLVSLVGYCIANSQRMLVYEFVPNSTMEHHLHGKGQPVMDWSSRVRIAIGSSKGLAYLHEDCHPRIIHRDIKAANILLDENYEAMVADFGLAKLTTDNFTHVSTRVMGTFGYLAPEYAASGKLSEKSDVFSFGVMLLELITGRLPVDLSGQATEDSLVDWARPLLAEALEDGDFSELADPNMEGDYDPHQMASMISCAAGSIRHSAKRRPKMSQIVRALEGESLLVEEGSEFPKRARSNNASTGSASTGSAATSHDSIYDTVAYNNDMMKFKKMILTDD